MKDTVLVLQERQRDQTQMLSKEDQALLGTSITIKPGVETSVAKKKKENVAFLR